MRSIDMRHNERGSGSCLGNSVAVGEILFRFQLEIEINANILNIRNQKREKYQIAFYVTFHQSTTFNV